MADETTSPEPDAPSPGGESRSASSPDLPEDEQVLVETTPTLKPTLVWLGLTIVVGLAILWYLIENPEDVGGSENANLLGNAVLALTAIAAIRLLIRMYILRRTVYRITDHAIYHRYELFLRTQARRVPLYMVRSHEYNQSRIQKLLGYGTIDINQGLGAIELANVPGPDEINDVIQRQIRNGQSSTPPSA